MIIVRDSYNNLCVLNFGKHSYSVIKNNDKVVYFESVNGKYVMPITNFNLYDNQGKSLTSVNHHFFMSQLVNRINVSLSKGYFRNDNELVDYLNNIKVNLEGDSNLKNLFKGSLMGEINEENFEKNKKEILKCLDQYKLDTFVDYNNVSIFNGSLDKTDNSSNSEITPVSDALMIADEFDFSSNIPSTDNSESVSSAAYFGSLSNTDIQNKVVSESIVNEENVSNTFDFGNAQSEVVTEPVVNEENVSNTFDFGNVQSEVVTEPVVNEKNVSNAFDFGNAQSEVVTEPVVNEENVSNTFDFGNVQSEVVTEPVVNEKNVSNAFDFGNAQSEVVTEPVVNEENVSNTFDFENVQSEVVTEPVVNEENVSNTFDFGNVQSEVVTEPVAGQQTINNVFGIDSLPNNIETNSVSQPTQSVENNVSNQDSIEFNDILSDISNSTNNLNIVNNTVDTNNNLNFVNNVEDINSNSNTVPDISQGSYINEVKDRIQSGTSIPNDMSSMSFVPNEGVQMNNTIVDNKNDLPELESISNDSSEVVSNSNGGNKNKVGIVVFMFILLALLVVAAYLLYNYVF